MLLMVSVALIGLFTSHEKGFKFRFQSEMPGLVADLEWNPSDDVDKACKLIYPYSPYCKIYKGAPASVALLGDSQANQLFYGLSEAYASRGKNLVQLGVAGCPPLLGIRPSPEFKSDKFGRWCEIYDDLLTSVVNDKNINTVILAANWHLYFLGTRYVDKGDNPKKRISFASFEGSELKSNEIILNQHLSSTLGMLLKAGKNVIFVKQVPELNFSPRKCRVLTVLDNLTGCYLAAPDVKKYLKEYELIIDPVLKNFAKVDIWEPVQFFCDANNCKVIGDQALLYRDESHLSRHGSKYFASQIFHSRAK